MDTIIGLGAAGCRIADEFAKYTQYSVLKIDTNIQGDNCFKLNLQHTTEDYEKNVPDMSDFFKDIDGEVLFILGGSGKISGASLRILQQLQKHDINILYIRPYIKGLNTKAFLQEKVVYNVLQEYARSGLFKRIFLVSNNMVEEIVGETSILEINNSLNKQIVSVIHFINVFQHTEPIINSSESPSDIARICTFGIQDYKSGEERFFFNLSNIRDKIYYYAIKEQDLKSDTKLIKNIRERLEKNDIRASYQVHSTKYEQSFCYFIAYSGNIQDS